MTERFQEHKDKLFALAYKMTKSAADAEDILQDIFLAFSTQTASGIRNPEAYLVKSVVNRCLSLLEKRKRLVYPGPDLPEPLFQERFQHMHRQDVSYALVLLLQQLNPVERAVFLLRESLDYAYPEIAEVLAIEEENCRQLLHRARKKVAEGKPRYIPSAEESSSFINAFLQVCASGNVQELMKCLQEDITIYSDGGGKVSAAMQPISGRKNCMAFLNGLYQKYGEQLTFKCSAINGENGILLYDKINGHVETVIVLVIVDGQISTLYFIRNPDKIRNLQKTP